MSRRRLSNYSDFVLPYQRNYVDSENVPKECLTQFDNLSSRDILTIQALNVVSIIYGVTFLTYSLRNDNFLQLDPQYQDLLFAYLTCTSLCYCAIVLFGAAVFSDVEETFVFSCILTAFVLVPSYFFYSQNSLYLLTRQKITFSPLYTSVRSVAYGSVIGAWFGAFVIPLDWERNWQKWPIPCVIGSLVGFVLGHAYSLISQI